MIHPYELESTLETCTLPDKNHYEALRLAAGSPVLTEYSLQKESGVLDVINQYTKDPERTWQNKKSVPLTVFQRQTHSWKLECEQNPETTLAKAISTLEAPYQEEPWVELQSEWNDKRVVLLVFGLIPPCFFPCVTIPALLIMLFGLMGLAS